LRFLGGGIRRWGAVGTGGQRHTRTSGTGMADDGASSWKDGGGFAESNGGERPRKKSKWDEKGPDPIPSPLPRIPMPAGSFRTMVRTKVLTIPAVHKGALIGKGGEAISAIRAASAAEIHIKHTESEQLVTITISGSNVELAEKLIGERLAMSGRSLDAGWESKIVDVPQELIGPTIGKEGCNLREMQERTGCKFKFIQANEIDPSVTNGKQVAVIRGPADKLSGGERALLEKVAEVQHLHAQKQHRKGLGFMPAKGNAGGVNGGTGDSGMAADGMVRDGGSGPCVSNAAAAGSMVDAAAGMFGKSTGKPGGAMAGKGGFGAGAGKGMPGVMGKGMSGKPTKGMDANDMDTSWEGPDPEMSWDAADMNGASWDGMDAAAMNWDGKGGMDMTKWYMDMWNSWWWGGWRGKKKPPIPCKFQMRGFCKNAERCTFSHDPEVIAAALGEGPTSSMDSMWDPGYKMIYCKYWDSGKCTRGATCTFAHGVDELRGGLTLENLSIMEEAQQMMSTSLKPDEVDQRLAVLDSTALQSSMANGHGPTSVPA